MTIALIGHGKMGREVERLAREKGVTIARIFSVENNLEASGITPDSLRDVEVCIDFSAPNAVVDNIRAVAACRKNIVVGTTGWLDQLPAIKALVAERGTGLLYSPNFSLGMNVFQEILEAAARLFGTLDAYDVAVHETHHRMKADSPSGTALALGEILLRHIARKQHLLAGAPTGQVDPTQIHLSSERVGSVVGLHRVIFDSEADTVELVHSAKNRSGFALGALLGAEWLRGKQGVFTMKDFMRSLSQ